MVRKLTLNQAKKLGHGTTLYHLRNRNADGTAQRWRVSGKPQTWKTRPGDVRVPIKHGMYDNDQLTQSDLHLVSLQEPKPAQKRSSKPKREMRRIPVGGTSYSSMPTQFLEDIGILKRRR